MITQDSLQKFLDDLSGSAPTPGGGSAAAIMGAVGAALVSMVCNVTLGKKGQEGAATEMQNVRAASEQLRARLMAMVAEDVAAFDGLMSAYRLPKSDAEQKSRRGAAIQASLRSATQTPLDCARACAQVISLARRAGNDGYAGVISDAGVAVLAAFAALRSAALNVYVNAPSLEDRAFAIEATAALEALLESAASETEAVFAAVRTRMG